MKGCDFLEAAVGHNLDTSKPISPTRYRSLATPTAARRSSELKPSFLIRGKQSRPALAKELVELVQEACVWRIVIDEPMHPLKRELMEGGVLRCSCVSTGYVHAIENSDNVRVSPVAPVTGVCTGEPELPSEAREYFQIGPEKSFVTDSAWIEGLTS